MSQNPYGYPYGGGQAPPQPYPYPPFSAYPPPTNGFAGQPQLQQHPFQSPSYPTAPESYYAASQSAFDHNAGSIPGLGHPSTSQFPMAFNASWAQTGYPAVGTPVQFPTPTHAPFSTQVAYSTPQFEAPQPSTAQMVAQTSPLARTGEQAKHEPKRPLKEQTKPPPKTQAGNTESEDEGEISDGYFDDLYDDVANQQSFESQQAAVSPARFADNGDTDALDQETNFYDTDMEEPSAAVETISGLQPRMLDGSKLAQEVERERTRSYSPHLSPAEVEQAGEAAATIPGPHNSQAMAQPTPGSSNDVKASIQFEATATTSRSFANLPEAHNEAKKAILRLLPHGVKFQTYIDEGFDADLIRSLFTQLNLPTDPVPTTITQKPVVVPEKTVQEPSNQKPQPAPADSMAKKQEERKDRIARLLAEKKAKAAVAPPAASHRATSNDAPKLAAASPASATKGATTRAENDRLLQQKIALIKARNTQKLGQRSPQTLPSGSNATAKPVTPQGFSEGTQPPIRPASVSGGTLPSQIQPPPTQHPASKPVTPLRPSSVTSSPIMANVPTGPRGLSQLNQRKRPVAADFMDGPAPSIKRPSLANRQNSSLVISISDDEDDDDDDDDDDVEMEVDSATDESSAPAQQSIVLPRRGPAIRDYPPLTNTNTPRQIPSPLSALAGKNANGDLEAKEKAIEALRRRIEEAEARAKIKPKKGSVTPLTPQTPQTPDAGNASPAEQAIRSALEQAAPSRDMGDKSGSSGLQKAAATVEPAPPGPATIAIIPAVERQPDIQRPAQPTAAAPPVKSAKVLAKEEQLRRVREERERLERLEAEISNDLAEEEEGSSQAPPAAETVSPSYVGANLTNVEHAPMINAPQVDSAFLEHHQTMENEATTMADKFLASMEHSPFGSASASNDSPPSYEGPVDTQDTSQGQVLVSDERLSREESADSDTSMSDGYEPPEAQIEDHMGAASFQSTPAVSDITNKNAALTPPQVQHIETPPTAHSDEIKAYNHEMPTQELAQPVETFREAANRSSPLQKTSFVPYESPLRYFHCYRFHPGFSNEVSGGLKSLTYSNRIDPNKEMCPDEWEGNDCPRGNACQFQHFHSIITPDNEIILELGNSDEFSGEQKKEFNKGLREMVAQFQKSKIRDFRTIAQAIVDFRRQFVSDPSKILRLEGVTL